MKEMDLKGGGEKKGIFVGRGGGGRRFAGVDWGWKCGKGMIIRTMTPYTNQI